MLKALDWLFVARPIVLIPAWAFLLAGFLRAHERAGETSPAIGPLLLPFALLTTVLAGVYIINQIYDRETDRENGKLFLLAEGHIAPRSAWIEAFVLVAAGFVAGAILRPAVLPWLAAAALLGILYSVPPARFKARPFSDLLANAVGYGGVTFLFGYSLAGDPAEAVSRSIPYMLVVAGVFLHTALVDQAGDRKAGLRTTAILLGDRPAGLVAILFLVAACLLGFRSGEPYATLAAIGGAPFFLWAVFFPGRKGSTLAYQWGSLLFVILLVIREPLFGLFLVALVAATRLYYRFRFGMVYPRLDF